MVYEATLVFEMAPTEGANFARRPRRHEAVGYASCALQKSEVNVLPVRRYAHCVTLCRLMVLELACKRFDPVADGRWFRSIRALAFEGFVKRERSQRP